MRKTLRPLDRDAWRAVGDALTDWLSELGARVLRSI
jgi:hypothetical protein